MAVTWKTEIQMIDAARGSAIVLATRTDVDLVQTYRVETLVGKAEYSPDQIANALIQLRKVEEAKVVSPQEALVAKWQDDIASALVKQEEAVAPATAEVL